MVHRPHFVFLDGLRGVAAVAVLLGHLKQTGGQAEPGNFGMAVDLFFILSGFVVVHAYGDRLTAGMTFWGFARLRLVRLYPMLTAATLAGLVLALALALRAGEPPLAELGLIGVLGLLCLPATGFGRSDAAFPLNPPQWSLFFEFAANFLLAALGRWFNPAWAWGLTAAGAVLLVGSALHFGYTDTGSTQADLAGGAARVLFGFFCGAALHSLARPRRLGVLSAVLIATGLTLALWPWWDAPVAVRLVLILLVFPIVIHAGAMVEVDGRIASVCRFLGAVSYPLYIIHTPLMGLTGRLISAVDPTGAYPGVWITGQALLFIIVSWLFVKLYDEPLRAWLTRRFGAHSSVKPGS